jgi:hypothetical protein
MLSISVMQSVRILGNPGIQPYFLLSWEPYPARWNMTETGVILGKPARIVGR